MKFLFYWSLVKKNAIKSLMVVTIGIKEYLVKPVEPVKLINKIKRLAFGGVA